MPGPTSLSVTRPLSFWKGSGWTTLVSLACRDPLLPQASCSGTDGLTSSPGVQEATGAHMTNVARALRAIASRIPVGSALVHGLGHMDRP